MRLIKIGHKFFYEITEHFNRESFDDYLNIVRSSNEAIYDPDLKMWGVERNGVKSLTASLKASGFKVSISRDLKEDLEPKRETKFIKIPLNNSLIKLPPKGDFQLEGIKKGLNQNRYLYAYEMGLGKTYIVINVLNHLFYNKKIDKVLIVVPGEALYNWRRELMMFGSFVNYDEIEIGTAKNRKPFTSEAKVVIITYRSLLMISDDYYKESHKGKKSTKYRSAQIPFEKWGLNRAIILDESHSIKNFKSRQAKILNFHKEFFEYRYLMTGTPTPNGADEYYNQLNFLDESIIDKNYYTWIKEIANTGNRFSEYGINYFYVDKVEAFVKTIKPWVGRIFTKDVMELPDLIIQNIYSHMSKKQLDIYRAVVSSVLVSIKEKDGIITTKKVQNQFPFISLALDNPSILKDKFSQEHNTKLWLMLNKWKFKDHSKLPQCDALINKYIEEGHKIIIWSGHPVTMGDLAEYYKKYNPIVIHGQIEVPKGKDRKEHYDDLLNSFKKNPDSKILIASYIVLSTAVTITEATRSIFFDRSYSSVFWQQSIKRNHRIGQDNTVIVNPLILENSLDVRLDKALNKKVDLNNNLLNNETLPKEEWKKIFEGE